MDIWAWVTDKRRQLAEQGQHRLASIMRALPTAVCDMRHDEAEALVPEGVALARELDEPWVEIFLRHWLMQSRVLHRYQGRDNTEECLQLLELAHRPGNRECPQSTCVVQDFANCYGATDGPGYAQERIDVTAETLARIDPSWPCFDCISAEHSEALEDAGRIDDAIAFLDAQIATAAAAGSDGSHRSLHFSKADCLTLLGRAGESLQILRELGPSPVGGESGVSNWRLQVAQALIGTGQVQEAWEELPDLEDLDWREHCNWLLAREQLAAAGVAPNDDALGRAAASIVDRYERDGVLFVGTKTALCAARLAARRGRAHQARVLLGVAEHLRGELRAPACVAEALAETEALVGGLAEPALDPSVDAPTACVEGASEVAEEALERFGAGRARWPEHERLACAHARALNFIGLGRAGRRELERALSQQPDAREIAYDLGGMLRDAGEHQRLEQLVLDHLGPRDPRGAWLLGTSHERAGRLERATAELRRLLELDPEADVARGRLCEIACRRRRWDEALELADELVAREEAGDRDWDRMVAATALGRWDLVRHSARRLGMEVDEGGEPIDEAWGWCRIRDESGRDSWSMRTGPVTARIHAISGPTAAREREGEVVLFDPAPVASEDREGGGRLHTYPELTMLELGERRSFTIDGLHPGEEALTGLVDALGDFDLHLQRRSGEGYVLTDGEDDEAQERPAVYLFATVPADTDLVALHAALQEATSAWAQPVVWLELMAALGTEHEAEAARQRALAERWGM